MFVPKALGGIEIYRASKRHEDIILQRIKRGVFEKFEPGTYTDRTEIKNIVNHMFELYRGILAEYLSIINSRELAPFLVEQYERYGQISNKYKRGLLLKEEEAFWQHYAGSARRGIKYLLELTCLSEMKDNASKHSISEQKNAIAMVFVAAEELVSLYMRSDNYVYLMEDVTLILNPLKDPYFNVPQDADTIFDPRDAYRDEELYIPDPDFLCDHAAHSELTEEGFIRQLGMTYTTALSIFKGLISTYSDSEHPERIGFFCRSEVLSNIVEAYATSAEQARLFLDGLSLSPEKMRKERRELFSPKQEYRAYKRPFFYDYHNGDELMFFSQLMAKECLTCLVREFAFKKVPAEWHSKQIGAALADVSLKSGRWFEGVVKSNLDRVGLRGLSSVQNLRFKSGQQIEVPADVGEIDHLVFCPDEQLLIVIEDKQVIQSTEPRTHRDDLSKFITGKNSYSEKFSRKYTWVADNLKDLEAYFQESFDPDIQFAAICRVMITRYPTFVANKINDFTCISLVEFMNVYSSSGKRWIFNRNEVGKLAPPRQESD
jgi:hypothetical protein